MSTLHGQLNPWEPNDLEGLHQAGLNILEETGVYVDCDGVLDILEATDAKVDRDSNNVRFPAAMVQKVLDAAPGSWDRPPSSSGTFSVSADCGSRFAWDYSTRQPRPGRPRDLVDVPRLVQAMGNIDEAGNLIFTPEIPSELLDLIGYRHMWNNTE